MLASSGNRCRIPTRASESTVFSASRPVNSDSVSARLTSQLNHISKKPVFIGTPFWNMPLCGTMLSQNPASPTLRDFELATHMINSSTTTRKGLRNFPLRLPSRSTCRALDQTQLFSPVHSPSGAASVPSVDLRPMHQTACASGNRFVQQLRSV